MGFAAAVNATGGWPCSGFALDGVQHGIAQDGVDLRLIALALAFEPEQNIGVDACYDPR